jgi:menaquinone-dependent protoporphyrinogen oxidase
MAFVEGNRALLGRIPVAYFLTCLALYRDTAVNRRTARGYMDPLLKAAPEITPVDIGLFPGVLDYGKLSFSLRMIMKRKMKGKGVPEGDFRNWDAIGKWTRRVAPMLGSPVSPEAGKG